MAGMGTLDYSAFEEFAKKFQEKAEAIQKGTFLKNAMEDIHDKAIEEIINARKQTKSTDTTYHDTGLLDSSWNRRPVITFSSHGVTDVLSNNVYYAPYVNYGHRIVRHGITYGFVPGQYFVEKGLDALKPYVKETAQKALNKMAKDLMGG